MDNVCHTLVGAAIGEAGLKRRTRFGSVTLMIAANLPDIDGVLFFTDLSRLALRRGWTHGVLAQLVLPILLAGAIWAVGRCRRGGGGTGPPVHAGWLLALSYVGVYSHVFLDYLNTYGIRLLAPFDWRWFYGDALFIIDPWLWLALGGGVWLARRQRAAAPARGALALAACYVAVMMLSARVAHGVVADVWRETRGTEPRAVMVGPRPITPLARDVIVDAGDRYETGTFTWWPVGVTFDREPVPKNDDRPGVRAARRGSREIQDFLVWSRFPFWEVERADAGTRVRVADMRFMAAGGRFGASTILDRPPAPSD